MKVLFFSHQAEFMYGGEICTLAFMAELKRRGCEVHFASPAGPYQERAQAVAHCHTVPSRQFSRRIAQLPSLLLSLSRTAAALRKICREHGIEIMHATSLKAMVYARGQPIPLVWHHHDILPPGFTNDRWLRWLGSRATAVIAPSAATAGSLVEAGLPTEKCHVLKNGFSAHDWRVRTPRQDFSRFRLGFVGELSPRKGLDRLPGILGALRRFGGDEGVETVVIGAALSDPTYASELKRSLREWPVSFLGRREDVKQLLQGIDLLLVPSRQDPLPTVIVEANWSGVPAIGSRVGGIPEMIEEGKNGFLAEAEEEWAEKIQLARALPRWRELSVGARAIAESEYDIVRQTERLQEIYRSAIKRY